MAWDAAIVECGDTMNATGGAGGGPFAGETNWRLPTQKELMAAYVHGVKGFEDANFIPDLHQYFWAASSNSLNTSMAWIVYLDNGASGMTNKVFATTSVVCVR